MPTPIVAQTDGPRLTVNELTKSPTLIPKRILSLTDQGFITDAVLRNASNAPSGSVLYHESTPLYAADDPQILDEFGEIPVTHGSVGKPMVARSVRRALGFRVSKTTIDRNDIDSVRTQMTQIANTMVRAWADALFSAIVANNDVQSVTVGTAWSAGTGSSIRSDVNAARYLIKEAAADTAGTQKFGYQADTLIISTETEQDFLSSDDVSSVFQGNIADENLKFTGKLPNKFQTLDVLVSWRLATYAPDSAIVLQREVFGGVSDERPLQGTPLYGEGGGPNGGPTESWRSDITRASAIFLDHPKAVCVLDGVNGSVDYPQGVTVN